MANAFNNVLADNKTQYLPVPASVAISIGDLLYWDSTNKVVKPLTSETTLASEALDQVFIAQNFAGVAADARLATDTTSGVGVDILVITDGVFEISCPSQTFHLGNLVGATWNGGAALVNQFVTVAKGLQSAIGRVVKEPNSMGGNLDPANPVTLITVRLMSRVAFDLVTSMAGLFTLQGNGAALLTDAAQVLTTDTPPILNMVPTAARAVKLPVEAQSAGLVFLFTNNSGGANTVTFQTSGGGAIKGNGAVPQNKTGLFFYDQNTSSWCGLVSA